MNDLPFLNDFVQAERLLRVSTPLGDDAFLAESFSGTEMVNGLFEFTLALRAKRDDVRADEIVGERVDVSLDIGMGRRRSWNGLVTALDEEPRLTRSLRAYVLTLRPDLWLLGQKSDCRIWQNRSSVDVAETLLSEHGLASPDTAGIHSPPPAHEYDVQWNETDLGYLLRRLEEDGIHYWIRQEDGGQRMALADSAAGWDKGADGDTGLERYAAGSADRNHISSWRRRFRFTPGRRAGRDWNFETPGTVPGADAPSTVKLPRNGDYELYEYPTRAMDTGANERASRLRMQSVEADHEALQGGGAVRTLAPGARLTLYDVAHPEHAFETSVILSVTHDASDTTYETGPGQPSYENRFTALPARLPATPHRTTPRPRIDGSQIALIAAPEGEEIHTDQYGRVKLWFPWDRRAKRDGSDTKWVRVAQPWAGGAWGVQVIPRIGMEAVVSFEAGDPDRPIVTALVPNPQQAVPYELPANKTRMVIRSDTHKGEGFNELSFDDENGLEEVFLHAQKDMTVKVRNHATERVDFNKVLSVGGAQLTEIQSSQMTHVGQNATLNVGAGVAGSIVRGALAASTFGVRDAGYFLAKTMAEMGGNGNYTLNAMGAVSVNAVGAATQTVGAANMVTVGGVHTLAVGGSIFESAGADSGEIVAGTKTIDAHEAIHLRCGKSEMLLLPDGTIKLKGTKLLVEEEEAVKMNAPRIDLN